METRMKGDDWLMKETGSKWEYDDRWGHHSIPKTRFGVIFQALVTVWGAVIGALATLAATAWAIINEVALDREGITGINRI